MCWKLWVDPDEDPRNTTGVSPDSELAPLQDYMTDYRLTLLMKCSGLSAEQLARGSVPPSTMSLLGRSATSRRPSTTGAARSFRTARGFGGRARARALGWYAVVCRGYTARAMSTSTVRSPSRRWSTPPTPTWPVSRQLPTPSWPVSQT